MSDPLLIFDMSPFAEPMSPGTSSMDSFGFRTNSAGFNLPSLPPSLLNSAAGTPVHSLGGSLASSPAESPARSPRRTKAEGEGASNLLNGRTMSPLMLDKVCEELLRCTRPRSFSESAAESPRQPKRSRSPIAEQGRAPPPASQWLRDFPVNPNPHDVENIATDSRVSALRLLEDEMNKLMGQVSF